MVDTDDTQQTTPGVWHKLITGELTLEYDNMPSVFAFCSKKKNDSSHPTLCLSLLCLV